MEDWDLLAVVRGHHNTMESHHQLSSFNNNTIDNNTNSIELLSNSFNNNSFLPNSSNNSNLSFQDQDELFNTYPHLFETATAFDELEELYKPFYPGPATTATATTVFSSSSNSSLSSPSSSVAILASHFESRQALERRDSSCPKVKIAKEPASKYKKRKNQQKRVVKEVREDWLSSDMWAWRKYGQKPIKGSPYPRSYYRCSSSKGCSARKQVERSPSNPDTFIITYTAEHSHPHPTRRNSLAGSTRTKFPGPGACPPVINDNNNNNINKINIDRDDSTTTSSEIHVNVDVKSVVLRHDHSQLFASLDDLERGLEELLDRDEDTASDDHDYINNDHDYDHDNLDYKSDLLLDDDFLGDYGNKNNEADWFVDQYNTTVTGAC